MHIGTKINLEEAKSSLKNFSQAIVRIENWIVNELKKNMAVWSSGPLATLHEKPSRYRDECSHMDSGLLENHWS